MAKKHHGQSITVAPDPFIKGKTGEILYRTHDSYDNAAAWINATDWDDPSMPVNPGQGMKATLSTIEIDEIEWTSQSLPLDYGKGNNRDPQWMKHFRYTEADVAKWSTLSYYDFVKTVGGPSYPSAGFDGVFYNVQNHSRLKSWGMYSKNPNPRPEDIQLIKEADESELTDTIVGKGKDSTNDPNAHGMLAFWVYKNPQAWWEPIYNKFITKMVVFMATEGIVHTLANGKQKVHNVIPGKNVLDVNEWSGNTNDQVGIRIVEGTLKVNKKRKNPTSNVGVYFNEAYAQNRIENWDVGWGIYTNDYDDLIRDETFRWRIPNQEHVMQLIGQAPATNEDIYFRMRDFLNVTPAEAHRVSNQITQTGLNTSGFSLYPVGSREQPQEKQFYSFGNLSLFRCGETAMGSYNTLKRFNLVTNNDGVIDSVLFNNTQHAAQIRHCKVKTDSELGYSLYIDEVKDKVLMLPYNASSAVVEYLPHDMCYENDGSKGIVNGFSQQWQMAIKVDITNGLALNIQTNTNVEKSYIHLFDKDMNFIKPLKVYPKGWAAISDRISLKDIPANAKYAVIHNNPGQYFEANVEFDDYDSRSTSQLRHGLERGIALRYTNRKHMKVLRKWSEIKAEAEEINSQILLR